MSLAPWQTTALGPVRWEWLEDKVHNVDDVCIRAVYRWPRGLPWPAQMRVRWKFA
ncbi:hypothetical protein [Nocardioides ferulae]|uniref:hypothetical protein n=1 Tax=Nocardioides ferulae TaxID=2340821 RepID=UPI0013DE5008|nr:hypothetical protein [Nocardioides ferulae]